MSIWSFLFIKLDIFMQYVQLFDRFEITFHYFLLLLITSRFADNSYLIRKTALITPIYSQLHLPRLIAVLRFLHSHNDSLSYEYHYVPK